MSYSSKTKSPPDQDASTLGHGLTSLPQYVSSPNSLPHQRSPAPLEQTRQLSTPCPEPAAPSASRHRIRRRNRMITSCLECRYRKMKCDRLHPCTNCAKSGRDCVFLAPATDTASQLKIAEIKEKMGVLERGLEAEIANVKKQQRSGYNSGSGSTKAAGQLDHASLARESGVDLPLKQSSESSDEDGDADVPEDEKDLEPTPLAVVDTAFDDNADDEIMDLGVKMGRIRLTERLGGYFRPKLAEELEFTLNLSERTPRSPDEKQPKIPHPSPLTSSQLQAGMADRDSFLEPGPTYIAPGSNFFFGSQRDQSSILDFLPSRLAGDRLITQYHDAVHFIARVVHWPSFQVQYENFWANISVGVEPPGSSQAIVFAVMFSAVVSMSETDVRILFSLPKKSLMATFQTATELAFGKANFLRTTKFETLQALVIYLIPMCRDEMSRAHSVLVATAIRLAECMGLHRDPRETYGHGPLDSHVRRILWYQLCFLDIRTAEAHGPKPSLRRDDFDSRLPLNVNDIDLVGDGDPAEVNRWTDMTFSKMRFECNEMHRVIWVDRARLERKEVSLTHVLGKIESCRKAMEARYHPMLDENVPLQKKAKIVMNLQLLRLHVMVLHLYRDSLSAFLPERIRQTIFTTGTQLMEDAVRLDIDPELQPWSWYNGAYQQWHTAFLLLVEIFSFPERPEADRIWPILDHVFETDPSMTREAKGRSIISELRDRTTKYRENRKMRPPVSMIDRLNASQIREQERKSNLKPVSDLSNDHAVLPDGASRAPLSVYHPTYLQAEYPPTASLGYESIPPSSHHHSAQSQASSTTSRPRSPGVPAPEFLGPSAAANLGQMTKAYAEASPPMFTAEPEKQQPWIFEPRMNLFVPQSQSPGDAALGRPYMSAGIAPTMPFGAGVQSRVMPPNDPNACLLALNGRHAGLDPSTGKCGDVAGDSAMADIDWGEWDKIFPPGSNMGIPHAPLPQHF